jgi:crotonobetainyl-CoA:carnitine CoA-transferase CaiB-like acyl-CoA transferase
MQTKRGGPVTTPKKPDLARGWLYAEKLLEKEIEWFDKASDDDVERMLDEAGIEVSRVPSAEELLARAEQRAAAPKKAEERPSGVFAKVRRHRPT